VDPHTVEQAVASGPRPTGSKSQTDTRAAVERLQHDLAELAATLERNESR